MFAIPPHTRLDGPVEDFTCFVGTMVQEPIEIPGGDFSLNALDPQGASFALVGARKG